MNKNWIRGVLAVVVLGAAGFGYEYHAHASGTKDTHWLSAIAASNVSNTEGTAIPDNSTSSAGTSKTASADTGKTKTKTEATNVTGNSAGVSNSVNGGNQGHQNTGSTSASGNVQSGHSSTHSLSGTTTSHTGTNHTGTSSTGTSSTGTSAGSSSSASSGSGSTAGKSSGSTNTSGGTSATPPGSGSFTVIISENKGATVLEKKTIAIHTGENLLDYMKQSFTIGTADGGQFVVSINGIKSQWTGVPVSQRQPVDWFLYINQVQAPVGAGSIIPRKGDIDDWDYHRWNPSTGQ